MTTKSAQCSKTVQHPGDSWGNYRCEHPVKVVEDGAPYCTIHAPSYVKVKRAQLIAAADAKWDAIHAKKRDSAHRIECYPELLAACEAILSGVSLDVYRVAAANMGRMAPAEAAFALLRAAINKARGTSELPHDKG